MQSATTNIYDIKMITFLQINVGTSPGAQDLMHQTASEIGAQILIVSEPARKTPDHWVVSTNGTSAIGVRGSINVSDKGKGKGFAWIKVANLTVYSCYWTPNVASLQEFEEFIEDNAKAVEWGSSITCEKGYILIEFIADMDFLICNVGNSPTFVRGLSKSIIDVTFATPRTALIIKE